MTRFLALFTAAVAALGSTVARAASGFATPPDDSRADDSAPRFVEPAPTVDDYDAEESTLRLSTGPVLRATNEHADGGFAAAVDVGARAAGVRFAGTWVRTGSDRGLSQYDGQLWIDFASGQRLHPILAAGAGLARFELRGPSGGIQAATVGIGSLRGTLEYALPIRDANARAGLDLEGALPAIRGASAPDVSGWVLVTARVGIGF